MKQVNWKRYLFWILLSEAVGAAAGWITRDAVKAFQETTVQPFFAPPRAVFPIVWGILYALMGIGAARVAASEPSQARTMGLYVFGIQLAANFVWSILFFLFSAYGLSFIWLLVLLWLVLWMYFLFREVDPLAAKLQIPYILWLVFAAVLNLAIWYLNG